MLKKVFPWKKDMVNGADELDIIAFGAHSVITKDLQVLPNVVTNTENIKQITESDLTYSQRGTTSRPNDADPRFDVWAYRNDGWGMSDSYAVYIKNGVIE